MAKIAKNILSLNHEEVMDFFMKSELYHGFELPEYFTFDEVLKYVRETIGDAPYDGIVDGWTQKEVTSVLTFREARRYAEGYCNSFRTII